MNKAIKLLDKIISLILIVLVAFLAVGVSATIVLRYFFGISFAAFEEFLSMSFIFITLFGSALAIREKQHISISFLANWIVGNSRKRKIISTLLIDVSILFVCSVLCVYSCKWIGKVGNLLSQNSHLPMKVYYIFMPITFGLTIVYTLLDVLGLFVKIDEPDEGYKTDDTLPEGNE
ncbi:MAG: TRAP transporter small permease subunit [Fretibacterium sp.]|nr:TRAP transporter small permease subunit [Fretibacterium sp.]